MYPFFLLPTGFHLTHECKVVRGNAGLMFASFARRSWSAFPPPFVFYKLILLKCLKLTRLGVLGTPKGNLQLRLVSSITKKLECGAELILDRTLCSSWLISLFLTKNTPRLYKDSTKWKQCLPYNFQLRSPLFFFFWDVRAQFLVFSFCCNITQWMATFVTEIIVWLRHYL